MNIDIINSLATEITDSEKMPVVFIGHGNPMYAITDNVYRKTWNKIGNKLIKPNAILCISAHWLTKGTSVCMVDKPKTIHDFGGFPKELYQQQYPAPGSKEMASLVIETVSYTAINKDFEWGLDHGAWSVLSNMYPKADIPVFQMSIDYSKPPEYHYNLGRELSFLRTKGVLILASGNIVHNIRLARWGNNTEPFDWAIEFDNFVKTNIEKNNPQALIDYQNLGQLADLAHPTNDHYLPLLYTLGLRDNKDEFEFFSEQIDMGTMGMRSVVFG
jgi:4,5-DOPA dioxygenase extradiol